MISTDQIMGTIIAGGQATRMNKQNKALKLLGDKSLTEHIAGRFAPQVNQLIINANRDQQQFAAIGNRIGHQPYQVVQDVQDLGAGPLAGLLQSMLWARKHDYPYLASVAGDTPFFPTDLVARLAASSESGDRIVIARSQGFPQPVFGFWPTRLTDDLHQWLSKGESNKVMAWVRTHTHDFVDFDQTGQIDPFFNINTPEDLSLAESILEAEAV